MKYHKKSTDEAASGSDDESSGEEYTYTPKGGSQGGIMSSNDKSRMAGVLANYLLSAEVKKIPVKRPDLVNLLSKEHQKHVNILIDEARNMLKMVYGYDLVELNSKKAYILVNQIIPETEDDWDNEDQSTSVLLPQHHIKNSLLGNILTVIFMSGGTLQEATLVKFLNHLEIDLLSKDTHPVHGSMSKLLQEYIRQNYLVMNLVKAVDPPIKEYVWGQRAKEEYDKKAIINFVCKMYGKDFKPEMWIEQWKQAIAQ